MASVEESWHTSGDSDIANESRHGEMGSQPPWYELSTVTPV